MTAQPPDEPIDLEPQPPRRPSGWLTLLDFLVLTMALAIATVLVGRYGVSLELLAGVSAFAVLILAAWRRRGHP